MNKQQVFEKYHQTNQKLDSIWNDFNYKVYEAVAIVAQYEVKILDSFCLALAKKCDPKALESDEGIRFKILAESVDKYGVCNPFVALRIYSRKIRVHKDELNQYKKQMRAILSDFREIQKALDSMMVSEKMLSIQQDVFEKIDYIQEVVQKQSELELTVIDVLEGFIKLGNHLSKNEFLSLITMDKSTRRWDGEPTINYEEWLKEIPETIDCEKFRELIFIDRIEHDDDCYLFDLYRDDLMNRMDTIEEVTGKGMFDVLEEVIGKPLQTYTVKHNEYGEVVSMELTKPRLKIVENIHEK